MSLEHMLWAARRAGPIDPTGRLVLMMLAAHSNVDGRAWPSIPTLARETGLHPGTVRKAMRRLEGAELVKIGHREGRTPEYLLPNTPRPGRTDKGLTTRAPQVVSAPPRAHHAPKEFEGDLMERARLRAQAAELRSRQHHPALGALAEDQ